MNVSNKASRDVIIKLLAFTFAMIVVPIGSYFVTVNTVFKGARLFPLVTDIPHDPFYPTSISAHLPFARLGKVQG
jgi:hypothetical protein